MPAPTVPPELLDLKLLPAWLKEPEPDYRRFEGETADVGREDGRSRGHDRPRKPRRDDRREQSRPRDQKRGPRDSRAAPPSPQPAPPPAPPLALEVRFLPEPRALENVTAQIKAGHVAYSVFALARMFLEKPERYAVHLRASGESKLFRLGDGGDVAADRAFLENRAFNISKGDFFTVEVTQSEPLKGNFSNVARCRLSGTLLGPTNHHAYQPQLRTLYEQRFGRRMSFADYQRQIEIVSDPAVVEQWKEQARNVTTFATKTDDPPLVFSSAADAERHFRQNYLPELVREATELTISGVLSRNLQDRAVARTIEQAWANETRSPSRMMQELAGTFRGAGLHIFRHRRGMLFVSPFRVRPFDHDRSAVSVSVNAILEAVSASPGIDRKHLLERLTAADGLAAAASPSPVDNEIAPMPSHDGQAIDADGDRAKLTLASDLRWLISEGYLIELNDGSLDLPKAKQPKPVAKSEPVAKSDTVTPREPVAETGAVVTEEPVATSDALTDDHPVVVEENLPIESPES